MRHLPLIISALALSVFPAPAAVPVRWTVETSRVQPSVFEAYQGETLDLAASLQSYGRPVAIPGSAALYWQTNGMGARWWTAPASVSSNVLSAVWSPTNDVGARVYTCFIGQPGGNYRAEFQLRLRPSPGASPNQLPLPTVTYDARLNGTPTINGTNLIDYVVAASGAEVDPTVPDWAKQPNPPQSGTDENAVRAIVGSFAETGTVYRAASVGNAEQWTDATGCVWRVELGSSFTVTVTPSYDIDITVAWWDPYGYQEGWYYTGHGSPNFVSSDHGLEYFTDEWTEETGYDPDGVGALYTTYKLVAFRDKVTNLVGRVATTDDIPTTPSEVGAAPASVADDISDAKMWAMCVYQYMLGKTNAWAAFTNYPPDRATYESKFHYVPEPGVDYSDVPSSMQLYEVRGGETNIVYDSRSWVAWYYRYKELQMLDRLEQVTNRIPAKGWAKYHAYSGAEVPSPDMTIIDTPYLVLQGGYEWEKTVTTHGTIFTIVSNGLSADFNSMENATNGSLFAIRDLEGNDVFSVRNEQSVLVSAVPKSVVTSTDSSGHTVASVRFVCDYEPVPGAALDIIPGGNGRMFLFKNDDPDCPAHITVGGSVPNWTVTAVSKGIGYPYTRMFIGAVYEQPGNKVVKSGYPFDISGGFMYNGVKMLPITNADHTVTWRWE